MAATAFSLHLRSTTRAPSRHPTFLLHFSSSTSSSPPSTSPPPQSTSSPPPNPNPNPNPNSDSFSSYFSDVKASLTNNNPSPPLPRQQFQKQFSATPPPPRQQQQQPASIDQIRRDLSEFRRRTAPPESALNPSPPARPVSFQELYQRNVTNKEGDSSNQMNKGRGISFDAIAESIRQMKAKSSKTNQDPLSLSNLKENFMLRPTDPRNPPFVMGSPRKLPETSFSRELKEKDGNTSPEMKTEFVKMYSYMELGKKLRKLRPEGKPEDGFSLQELNDRLIKLREMEEREAAAKIGNVPFVELRQSLYKMQSAEDEKKQKQLQMFTAFNPTPDYMEKPPKEHLVEKYFHPDNMSSAEKLKIELQKVRDEFKMSESDCGSARVQVAQLTTKIKHLTTALHKKDTHSRKGLQGMIQQRKKLLKYLRRTDWDSYTLVLSKFGLRDYPDHKRLPTKEKKIRKA